MIQLSAGVEAFLSLIWEPPATVPYEGENFANSKMDNFSLIIDWLNFVKIIGMIFDVNAKQGSIL